MKPPSELDDVSDPRPRRIASLHEPSTEMEFYNLADEPPSRSVSHTPPLPASDGSRPTFDPLEDFSQETSNLEATDRCLAAACSLLDFQIAEVRTVLLVSCGAVTPLFLTSVWCARAQQMVGERRSAREEERKRGWVV